MRMFKSFSLLKKQNEIVCKVNILMCTDYTEFQSKLWQQRKDRLFLVNYFYGGFVCFLLIHDIVNQEIG